MAKIISVLLAFFLVACASAEQKPEKKWNVKVTKSGEKKVWVTKSDGSKQCAEAPPSITPTTASEELKALGVMVYEGRTGNDGMMHPAVCGAGTGNTVDLQIAEIDLPKALAKGFKQMKTSQN